MLSMSVADLMVVQDEKAIVESISTIYEKGEIVMNEWALNRQQDCIPLLIYAKKTEWDGQAAVLSIGTDMTQNAKAEKILQESIAENQRILNNLQDGFYRVDLDGNFLMINPRLAEMHGYDNVADMLTIKSMELFAHQEDRANLLEKLQAEGHVTNFRFRARRKDKTEFWAVMHMQHVRNENGDIIGYEGLIHDITYRASLEDEVQKQQEWLMPQTRCRKAWEQSINALANFRNARVYTAGIKDESKRLAFR